MARFGADRRRGTASLFWRAALSRSSPAANCPATATDTQARYIEAAVNGVLIASLYAPNGNPQPGPKFDYKLAWMDRLAAHAADSVRRRRAGRARRRLQRRADRSRYLSDQTPTTRTRCCSRKPRALCAICSTKAGATPFAHLHPDTPIYTYWSYLRNRWPRDAGLRIDHLLLSKEAAKRLVAAGVDRAVRGKENASDHAPVWIELRDCRVSQASRGVVRARAQNRVGASPTQPSSRPEAVRNTASRRPLLVIDGDFFAHRAYHALPKTIRRKGDRPAGAILGFANLLLRLYRDEQPRAVLVGWDTYEEADLSPRSLRRLIRAAGNSTTTSSSSLR